MLSLIPAPYRMIALAAVVAVAAGGIWMHGSRHGKAVVQQQWDAERAAQMANAVAASEAARVEEQRRSAAQQETQRETNALLQRGRVAADRVASSGVRLLDRASAAAVCDRAPANPTAVANVAPASSPTSMYADVLGRVVILAGQYAVIADQRGIAGSACEREYDSLTRPGP